MLKRILMMCAGLLVALTLLLSITVAACLFVGLLGESLVAESQQAHTRSVVCQELDRKSP